MATTHRSIRTETARAARAGTDRTPQTRPAWVSPSLFPFTSRWGTVNGARLHYVDEGRGPVLLMLPGGPMWSFMYRRPIQQLRDEFRCVALDLPGFGLSDVPLRPGRTFARSADLLQEFVRSLDLRDVTLVIHATAGPSALEMAVREHDRVRALLISNTFAWPFDDPRLRRFARIVGGPLFGFANVRLNVLPWIATRMGRRTGPFSAEEQAAIAGPFQRVRTRKHLQNYLSGLRVERAMFEALTPRLDVFRQTPALLLFGALDNGFKAGFLDRWKKLLPNHEAIVFPRAGHFLVEDEPDRFASELRRWFRERVDQDQTAEGAAASGEEA